MVKPELGTKRTCPNCATRFYDLLKDPIVCPSCATSFVALQVLPSKTEIPGLNPQVAPKPAQQDGDDQDTGEVELISLEEAEAAEKGDDETAGAEGVDLGDDEAKAGDDEDDTFLVVEEEDNGNMSDLVEGGGGKDEEEQ